MCAHHTIASLEEAQEQQPSRPRQPEHPFVLAPPIRAANVYLVLHPPPQLAPSCLQLVRGGEALGLDDGRVGNFGVIALAVDAAQRAGGISICEARQVGGAKDEDRRQRRAVGDEAVTVEDVAAGMLLLLGQLDKFV